MTRRTFQMFGVNRHGQNYSQTCEVQQFVDRLSGSHQLRLFCNGSLINDSPQELPVDAYAYLEGWGKRCGCETVNVVEVSNDQV